MRIVIDLQGAQSDSRLRGIGRYSLALAEAMIRCGMSHEYVIALNGLFHDSIEPIRAAFDHLLPQSQIKVWSAVGPTSAMGAPNYWRRMAAERVRESFLQSLCPDIVHVTSLFDGFYDNAVHSVGSFAHSFGTAITFYDVIPLLQKEIYLDPHPEYARLYREKLNHLRRSDILFAISESSRNEAVEHLNVDESRVVNIAAAVGDEFSPNEVGRDEEFRIRAKFGLSRPFLMYSGATDERKNHIRLIRAFAELPRTLRERYQLAIVGRLPDTNRLRFYDEAKAAGLQADELVVTGGVSDHELLQLYRLCHAFVFPSWHEGFGLPALEAMACGAAVIASNTTSLPEVIGRSDALFDPFDEKAIARKISEVVSDENFRQDLKRHGLQRAREFSWEKSARTALSAMEAWDARRGVVDAGPDRSSSRCVVSQVNELVASVAAVPSAGVSEQEWTTLATAIAWNHPRIEHKQLFVDVSELIHRDPKSGIQRVVRSVLLELIESAPAGYVVEPVYAVEGSPGYRYARRFTQNFLGLPEGHVGDEIIEPANGDIFLGLDLQHGVTIAQTKWLRSIRALGVQVYFVVYDLIPIVTPWAYPADADFSNLHSLWLDALQHHDGVICISRAVADEVSEWVEAFGMPRERPFRIGWFHLGADVAQSAPTDGLGSDAPRVLEALNSRPTFLAVGTIEPRKGQAMVLKAFERLWKEGHDINLVFIGKKGWSGQSWNVEEWARGARSHSEYGRHFFWLEAISDEYLEAVYQASDCLVAASLAEGFGLPLIEAARHGLSLIVRDIPVFREVAQKNALYFKGNARRSDIDDLAECVAQWLDLQSRDKLPKGTIPWMTWKESTTDLMNVVIGDNWYKKWAWNEGHVRLRAVDTRFGTEVGDRRTREVATTGKQGWLLFGPYVALDPGEYKVTVRGRATTLSLGSTRIEATLGHGKKVLANGSLKSPESLIDAQLGVLNFRLEERCEDLEIRIHVSAAVEMSVSLLDIRPLRAT